MRERINEGTDQRPLAIAKPKQFLQLHGLIEDTRFWNQSGPAGLLPCAHDRRSLQDKLRATTSKSLVSSDINPSLGGNRKQTL